MLDADVFPINVELIGDDHGEMSLYPLTDFGILGHDGDDAVSRDAKKCRREKGGGRGLGRLGKEFGDGIEMESDENASAGNGGDAKKTAAIEESGLHRTSLVLKSVAASVRCGRHGWYCNAVQGNLVSPFSMSTRSMSRRWNVLLTGHQSVNG